MKEKDLPIDLTKHKAYSKNAKKCVQKLLHGRNPIRTNLASGPEETRDSDADLDRRGGSYSRNRHPAALKGEVR